MAKTEPTATLQPEQAGERLTTAQMHSYLFALTVTNSKIFLSVVSSQLVPSSSVMLQPHRLLKKQKNHLKVL